jgi:pimeloyl-ACP methyl ester carboxylesterase
MPVSLPNGCKLNYLDSGKGIPLVLLHAFPLTSRMWEPQIEGLADQFRIIAPDLRGFGETSGFSGPPSVGQMADDVNLLLDAMGITEPVVLGGLSMGGYVALAFARSYPQRLRGLLLAVTRAEPDTNEGKAGRDKMIAFTRQHTAADVIDSMLSKMLSATASGQTPQVAQTIRQLAAVQSTSAIVGALEALRDRPDARPGLATISVPTLVIVGEDDVLTPPEMSETLAAGIRSAKLVTLAAAGHMSNLEQPAAFNAAVREHFGR